MADALQPLIDTHIHLDDEQFNPDRDAVMLRAQQAMVSAMVIPAVCASNWPAIRALAERHSQVFATIGLHPLYTERHTVQQLQQLESALALHRYVAIGEIGLDAHQPNADLDQQRGYFVAQLQIARQHDLPVIIHARKTVEEIIGLLRQHGPGKGVIHSYNGSLQQAHRLIDLGYSLGFGGPVTYPRANKLRRLVTALPMQHLMLETDAPFQPVYEQNGPRNEPANIRRVLDSVATLRNAAADDIARASNRNAAILFALPDAR